MKVESRGKYPGVKLHLEPEECELLIKAETESGFAADAGTLARQMGKKIAKLRQEQPNLLTSRSTEEVAAIMAKEIEKQTIQLAKLKQGKDWSKVNQDDLKAALLAHVKPDVPPAPIMLPGGDITWDQLQEKYQFGLRPACPEDVLYAHFHHAQGGQLVSWGWLVIFKLDGSEDLYVLRDDPQHVNVLDTHELWYLKQDHTHWPGLTQALALHGK